MYQDRLRKLIRRARQGNKKAQDELNEYTKRTSKIVNKRLDRMRAAGIHSRFIYRVDYFLGELGRTHFSSAKNIWNSDLGEEELLLLNKLYESGISVTRMREQYNKAIVTFRKQGFDVPQGSENLFFEFLSQDLFSEFAEYDSGRALETIVEAVKTPLTMQKMQDAYLQYKSGNYTLREAWESVEEWIKIR